MVESFSLLAVGTSMIGTLLGFSEFFKEQLKNLSWHSSSIQVALIDSLLLSLLFELRDEYRRKGRNKIPLLVHNYFIKFSSFNLLKC